MIREIVDRAGFWQKERMCDFLLVVDTGPYHLQAALRLEFDNADFELLVHDDSTRGVVRRHDFSDTLIQ